MNENTDSKLPKSDRSEPLVFIEDKTSRIWVFTDDKSLLRDEAGNWSITPPINAEDLYNNWLKVSPGEAIRLFQEAESSV